VTKEKFMSWLNDFAEAAFSLNAGQTIEGYQPIDFYHFFPLWYDLFIDRTLLALKKIDALDKPYSELKNLFYTPSNLRSFLQKSIPSYMGLEKKNPESFKVFTSFIARMLTESCPKDPFGLATNPLYPDSEISEIIKQTTWQKADPSIAKLNGQLITAAGSLVHGLYNDLVTDLGWDAYGPYNNISYEGQSYSLLVRHFPNLQPSELWPQNFLASVKEVKIFQLYQNVQWHIGCVGCHTTLLSGNPITGLKYYVVTLDGKLCPPGQLKDLIRELGEKAEKIYMDIRKMDFEQLKQMVMLQECFQMKKVYDAAGMDWHPTEEMIGRIADKPLLTGLLPQGKFMDTLEEYKKTFGYYIFEEEVLKQTT
jgi:hypothetical protein